MAFPERPEPMNAITHHSKVKVSVAVADPTFVAGKYVSGKVEMECRADKGLGVGMIMVELFGIQELSSRDHSATSTFLHAKRLFQGPGLPPSNAVQAHAEPGDPPLPSHHYHARRGISTFLFRIPLPITCPSSVSFGGGLATVKYELRASASVYWRGEKRLVTERKVIDVVEGLNDVALTEYVNGAHATSITVGENGKLSMQGSVIGGGIITAGESACIELQVKNHSSKKNTGLTLTLTRRLVLPSVSSVEKQPLQISDTLTHVAFHGPEYIIHPGVEGIANLVFDIPKTARGVKGGVYLDEGYRSPRETQSIFEVQCIVSAKMSMGIGSKDLVLDIPVTVVNPLAIPDVLMALPQEQVANAAPVEHFSYPIHISYPDPTAYAMYPSPVSSPPPVALSPLLPMFTAYTDQNHVWLPPPLLQSPSPYQYIPPINPLYMQMIAPPPLPIQNLPPPRPASALACTQPHSYFEPTISGLPNSAAQHPLLPLNLAVHYESRSAQELDLEPEEGKGERASRVAHRLHMSCRHRSVSPRSHRFPLPQSSPGRANMNVEPTVQSRDLPPLPLVLPSLDAESGDPLPTTSQDHPRHPTAPPSLYSPRPIPSPQMSNTSLPRSERVEELERIAAAEEDLAAFMAPKSRRKRSRNKNKSKGKQKQIAELSTDINRTLPPLPVSTHKVYLSPPEVGLSDYFSPQRRKSEQDIPKLADIPPTPIPAPIDRAPPTPTLTAITPARHMRCNLAENPGPENAESGLDALERRLLAEVGTQKMERIFTSAMDSRNLFAGPSATQGAGGSVTLTRNPTKGRLSPIKIPAPRTGGEIESDGLNIDSAISSLTLADGGWAMQADRRAKEEKEPEQVQDQEVAHEAHEDRDSDERTHRAGTVGGKSKSKSSFSGDDGREERRQRRRRRQDPDDMLVDSEPEGEGESRSREGSTNAKKSCKKKKEGHRLRKAVKGRVSAWLGNIDPEALPPEEDFIEPSYSEPVSATQHAKVEIANTISRVEELPVGGTEICHVTPLLPSAAKAVQPDVPISAPNPRSSGFMPISPEKLDTMHHVTAANSKRQSHVNHLTQFFARIPSSAHAPVGDMKGDTSSHITIGLGKPSASIVRPSLPPRATSNPVDRGFKLNAGDGKNKIGAVKAALNDLSKVARSAVEQRSALVWSNTPGAQPLPYLHVPSPSPSKQQIQDPEAKYDVRSARGGRGGHVTAIAAFWAAAAKEASKEGPSRLAPGTSANVTSPKQAPSIVAPKPVIAQRINEPLITERPATQPPKPIVSAKSLDANKAFIPVAVSDSSPKLLGLAGKTKPATKSSSVPAVVSSSLATPMLSSTASLARPPVQQPRRPVASVTSNNFITSVEPSNKPYGPTKAKSTPDLAFGKARLRDLIRKYQERGS
ncbi:hypothetical protein AX14_009312 [Amanita brunnescens Koide BX004]|nr:hypothetical protein AX14_009312 [Amanita brunnescens Koide BX004]